MENKLTVEQRHNNMMMLKALELTDSELAKEAMSNPSLDNEELNRLVEDALTGKFVRKDDNSELALKISPETVMAGLRNILKRVIENSNNETK